jgi:hypothetical protein
MIIQVDFPWYLRHYPTTVLYSDISYYSTSIRHPCTPTDSSCLVSVCPTICYNSNKIKYFLVIFAPVFYCCLATALNSYGFLYPYSISVWQNDTFRFDFSSSPLVPLGSTKLRHLSPHFTGLPALSCMSDRPRQCLVVFFHFRSVILRQY